MCMDLRGASYYGASLHISVALLFLGGFFIDLVGISEVWHNPYATYFSLILAFIYICLFLVFGLLIFRGVELESAKLLKGAIAGFLVLQISAFVVYLAMLGLTNSRKTAERNRLLEQRLLEESLRNNNSDDDDNLLISNYTTPSSHPEDDILDTNIDKDDDDKVLEVEDVPIITVLQIISLVLGILTTIGYAGCVVRYVKSLTGGRSSRH